jgi:hypothetical protein
LNLEPLFIDLTVFFGWSPFFLLFIEFHRPSKSQGENHLAESQKETVVGELWLSYNIACSFRSGPVEKCDGCVARYAINLKICYQSTAKI